MRAIKIAVCGLLLMLGVSGTLSAQEDVRLLATTTTYTNFRVAPALNATIITTLNPETVLTLTGRTVDARWLQARWENGEDQTEGWVFFTLAATEGDIERLSIIEVALPSLETNVGTTATSAPIGNVREDAATNAPANFRIGPSTGYRVVAGLTAATPLTLTGRSADALWLQVLVAGQLGWIYAPLVDAEIELSSLPIVAAPALATTPSATGDQGTSSNSVTTGEAAANAATGIISGIGSRSLQIFATGQSLGNRADVFSKVGDSISTNPVFLYPIGVGGLQLGPYSYLQPTVDFFTRTTARTHNSFANDSLAVRSGWTSADVLNPTNAPASCGGANPLVCEYSSTRPAVALIMFGTNDLLRNVPLSTFQGNMQAIITTSIDMGVIPVISTVPDIEGAAGARVAAFNRAIRALAASNGIPLWDYWTALQSLPGRGLSGDGYHPSLDPATGQTGILGGHYMTFGYNVRNYTALVVLDTLRQRVLS